MRSTLPFHIFLLLVVLIFAAVEAKPPPPSSTTNPAWRLCLGFQCEEDKVCVIHRSNDSCGPTCVTGGPLTCATVDCIPGYTCIHEEVDCVQAPCYPAPTCVPMEEDPYLPAPNPADCFGMKTTCPPGEYFNGCGGCDGTCETGPVACIQVCEPKRAGCRCSGNLLRGPDGKCIEEKKCPTELPPSYVTTPTKPPQPVCNPPCGVANPNGFGWVCVDTGSGPQCVEVPPPLCSFLQCTPPQVCDEGRGGCVDPTPTKCGLNEEISQCGSQCEAKCANKCEIIPCPPVCLPPACACKNNFFRNSSGACVSRGECKGTAFATSADIFRMQQWFFWKWEYWVISCSKSLQEKKDELINMLSAYIP